MFQIQRKPINAFRFGTGRFFEAYKSVTTESKTKQNQNASSTHNSTSAMEIDSNNNNNKKRKRPDCVDVDDTRSNHNNNNKCYKTGNDNSVAQFSNNNNDDIINNNNQNNNQNNNNNNNSKVNQQQHQPAPATSSAVISTKPALCFTDCSNQTKDGKPKTWLEKKHERDRQEFFSRDKIDPYIPKDKPELLFDMTRTPRYKIIEEYDKTLLAYRQRMERWYKERENKITGSKLVNALGIFGIVGLQIAWYETYDPENPKLAALKALEDEVQKEMGAERMAFGTANEIHANATIIKHLGDSWNIELYETPLSPINPPEHFKESVKSALKRLWKHEWNEERDAPIWVHCFADSPDGKCQFLETGQFFSVEDKTPLGNRDPLPYSCVKYYYYPQCQLHMLTLPIEQQANAFCLFCSWSPTLTKVWKVKYDPLFWQLAMPTFLQFRKSGLEKKCPEKLFDEKESAFISMYIKKYSQVNSELVGEFPSVFSTEWEEQVREQRAALFDNATANVTSTTTANATTTNATITNGSTSV
jgi:hypothetical protein